MRKSMGKTPMSELLQKLTRSCFADRDALDVARTQAALWQTWLLPVTADTPVGEDPGYHDDFLRIRDEMNKLSGADTGLICQLAESLLLTQAKDVRIATYYIWARLHRDGERGLSTGERKMLHNARQILLSEVVLAEDVEYADAEARVNAAMMAEESA